MNKYEQLIEHIINDEQDKARELFHTIVVEKSRDIYESLIDEEDLSEVGGNKVEDLAQDVQMDEEGISEEEEEFDSEEDGLELDDMGGDEEGHHDDVGGDEELEDRVMDLEDALDELKAEFDALMAGEEGEHHDMGGEEEFGDEGEEGSEDEEVMEAGCADDEEGDEDEEMDESMVREYVEKVAHPANSSEGHEVAHGGSANVNKSSVVAGKNDMGGSAKNLVRGDSNAAPDGTSPKAAVKPKGNLPHAGSFENVPGAKAGQAFAKKESAVKKEEGAVNKTTPVAK